MAIWHGTPPELAKLQALHSATLIEHLGIEIVALSDNSISGRMPVDQRTLQPFGRLHGGASVALAETLGSLGGALTVDPKTQAVVGMEINANHIRPVQSGFVHGVAQAESMGRTTQIWSIRITDEQDRLVCLSRMTLAVIAAKQA
jgi:1,4-dihydroxy-2-naphthoyl-CoA hydrolase